MVLTFVRSRCCLGTGTWQEYLSGTGKFHSHKGVFHMLDIVAILIAILTVGCPSVLNELLDGDA
ncbi:hypothetical protein BJ985_001748 [Corynebacterium tuberculostearicum]|nr:hypothetical protein [Corynebacterium tuberculostearicum]